MPRRLQPLLLSLLLAGAGPAAAAETPAEIHRLADPLGPARLTRPAGLPASPLVVILPDALGEDGRSEPYVDSLLARGIASLVLGLGEDADGSDSEVDPAASPGSVPLVLAWAGEAGFPADQVGLLGFGLGGRAALAGAQGLPAVALYPGCTGLPVPAAGSALILQGAEQAADCDALPPAPGLALRLLARAGHAWDAPGAIWPSPGPVLPDPAGGGRLQARSDLAVTLEAAEAVADWFEAALPGRAMRAAR